MPSYLLIADSHFTDSILDSYRWNIFDTIKEQCLKNSVDHVYLLGDFVDRKDRHTGRLVNKITDALDNLSSEANVFVSILAGNHDAPLEGVYYWEFLNKHKNISYITKPEYHYEEIWALPFSPNPILDWADIPWSQPNYGCNAIFMHQPVEGAFIDEYRTIKDAPLLPDLPKVPVFSGDMHHQQIFNNIIYIGVPYPTHFNETWKMRIVLVKNSDFEHYESIWLDTIKRAILEIKHSSELVDSDFKEGDQVRIRYKLEGDSLVAWPEEQQSIREWASRKGIYIASLEAAIIGGGVEKTPDGNIQIAQPEELVNQFCNKENLSEDIRKAGLELLKES